MKSYTRKIRIVLAIAFALLTPAYQDSAGAQIIDDPSPPREATKLIFIHHSCGENWLADDNGGLGLELGKNHYFVSDTNYGWGPDNIGDRTDIPDWLEWFRSEETNRYMDALFNENARHSDYSRTLTDPGGENEIVLFKSCFPNSNLDGNPKDPAQVGTDLTVANAKYVYNELLKYFATQRHKLFVVITAPPLIDSTHAENARAFNDWLVDDWRRENDYAYDNVAVFDFYNVLTGPDNHHRYLNGAIEHSYVEGMNTAYYPSAPDDDHPSRAGNLKARDEFVPLLNIFYHRWQAGLPGEGSDYYVDPTGSDANPGTAESPWRTIQKAAATVMAGDTVHVRAGTYNEQVKVQHSGMPGARITFIAEPGEKVVIDGQGIDIPDYGGLFELVSRSYISVSGFTIQNAGPNLYSVGLLADTCSHVSIENNHVIDTTSSGIAAWGGDHIEILDNEVERCVNGGHSECLSVAGVNVFEVARNHVHDTGENYLGTGSGGEGICIKDGSADGSVHDNEVHHVQSVGIYVDAWDKHTHDISVFRNRLYETTDLSGAIGGSGIGLASESGGLLENVHVYNNVSYRNGYTGLIVGGYGNPVDRHPIENVFIVNNTFYGNGSSEWGGGILLDNPAIEGVVLRNNLVSQNSVWQIYVLETIPSTHYSVDHNLIDGFRGDLPQETLGEDAVEGDPRFRNVSAADFHLLSDSPAIDTGSSQAAPVADFDRITRPQGEGYDIGAFEFTLSDQPEAADYYRKVNAYFYGTFGRSARSGELAEWGAVLRDNHGSVWKPQGVGLQPDLSEAVGWGTAPLDLETARLRVNAVLANLFGASGDIDPRITDYYIEALVKGAVRPRGFINAILNDLALMPRVDGTYGQPNGWVGGPGAGLLTSAQLVRYRERVEHF
jgi:hypothetical protein